MSPYADKQNVRSMLIGLLAGALASQAVIWTIGLSFWGTHWPNWTAGPAFLIGVLGGSGGMLWGMSR